MICPVYRRYGAGGEALRGSAMALKRSSLTPLFITSGIAGLALNALVAGHAQAQQTTEDGPKETQELPKEAPAMPRAESQVLISQFNRITRNNARISEYTALIETQDRKLVVCAGLKIEDYSFQEIKPAGKAQILVTSPQVADLLRPAPEENANAQGAARSKNRSYGSCMPYRVHFSDSILNALRNGNSGPMVEYMGQIADPVGIALIDDKDGVLASQWMNIMTDPSKRLPGFELPDPVEPPKFNDGGKQRDYIRALQDQPPYKIGNMKACPNTGYNNELADAIGNWSRRTTAPIKLRGCSPI
jgi:hypothetical protein